MTQGDSNEAAPVHIPSPQPQHKMNGKLVNGGMVTLAVAVISALGVGVSNQKDVAESQAKVAVAQEGLAEQQKRNTAQMQKLETAINQLNIKMAQSDGLIEKLREMRLLIREQRKSLDDRIDDHEQRIRSLERDRNR